ncbi:MAG: glutathione S-transferase family protein [Acidobacteriota bacterium]
MSDLTLFTLPPSPHNIKVRLALKLKGLSYETVELAGFDDRDVVVEKSGQPLTPVLEHGDRVVYDSFGIVRYLDANWPEPRLFGPTREAQQAIQVWERWVVNEVAPTLGEFLGLFLEGQDDADANARIQARFDEFATKVEEALADVPFLGGDALNAADLTVAPFLGYAATDPATLPEGSPGHYVASRLSLDERFPSTRAWIESVMAIDRAEVGERAMAG